MNRRTSVDALEKAFISFDAVINKKANGDKELQDIIRDSTIQRFEYTYELSWKLIQRVLVQEFGVPDITQKSKKDLFREAKHRGIIDNIESWFSYHEARNNTSHIYDEATANAVLKDIHDFSKQVSFTLNKLKELTA